MKIDIKPFNVAETNYVEPLDINMVELSDANSSQQVKVEQSEATEGFKSEDSFDRIVEDFVLNIVEVTQDQAIKGNVANDAAPKVENAKATEGLRVKFEEMKIAKDSKSSYGKIETAKGQNLEINMIYLNQPTPEMEEIEIKLKLENDQMRGGYSRSNESLCNYLFRCHVQDADMLTCPRCSIIHDQRATTTYERIQKAQTAGNWRSPNKILTPYPKLGESLLGFLVRCQKSKSICLMCPKCGVVYD